MHRILPGRSLLLAFALVPALMACAPQVEKPPVPPEAEAPMEPAPLPVIPIGEGRVYRVDPASTDLRILVYRGGRLARLGHNHVISSQDVQGTVVRRHQITGSALRLQIPVATLIVDDPRLRAEAGPEFDTEPSQADIDGTRRNLLSTRVLDAEAFPVVSVAATVVGGEPPDLDVDVDMTIRHVTQRLRTRVKMEEAANLISTSGEFSLRQSDFDMIPFSVLGGALKVKDEVTVRYRIVARPAE